MPADASFKPQKEINRVKAQLRHLEKEKSKSFPDLGTATYQAFIEGRVNDPALAEACGRLKSMDEQIEEGNVELERLKAQVQQMKSGGGPQQPGASCPYCKAPPGAGYQVLRQLRQGPGRGRSDRCPRSRLVPVLRQPGYARYRFLW